jgi:DNA-binding CsgD family transcriptional regulator/tetratricopeptide (TPR) repeat protein
MTCGNRCAYSWLAMSAVGRCPVLVERDDELRALSRLARDASALGGACAIVVTGEAGTGKSRLAQEFVASLPEMWSARRERITRTRSTVPVIPEARPVVFVLDDAHFLEAAAFQTLSGLLDELGSEAVVLVLTFRLAYHPPGSAEMRALAGFVRDPRANELRLMPLSPTGIDQMAASMGRYVSADLYRRTGGNPFWAEEVLRSGDRVPWTVVEAVTGQLDVLPPAARDLAYALAVAEEPVPSAAAARVVADLDAAWTALVDTGLAPGDPSAIGLRHELVAEAVQARLGPTERAGWHERLAAALESEPVERDRVARHWAAAGATERAASIARSAAPELRAIGATRRAFECFRLAVHRPPEDPEEAAALYAEAALTAAGIGEYETMRGWISTAERLYREAGRADRAIRMLLDPAFDYLPVRRSAAVDAEPVERLLVEAQAAMTSADPQTAQDLIDAAVEAARVRRDGLALGRAARMVMFALGEYERGERLLDESLGFPDIARYPGRESRVLAVRARAQFASGYPLAALDLLRRAVAVSRREPEAVVWHGQMALANTLMLTGHIAEGTSMMLDVAGALPGSEGLFAMADGYRRYELGETDAGFVAERGTDLLLADLDYDPVGLAVTAAHVLRGRALAEVHSGRFEDAVRTVRRLDALAPEPFSDVASDVAYVLARCAVGLDDPGVLAQARHRIDDVVRVASGPGILGIAEAVRAYGAQLDKRSDEAARRLQAAAAVLEQAPRPVLAAELWCDAALVIGGGHTAAAALDRAQRICVECGLGRVANRIAAIRADISAGPPRLSDALAHLTSREREVVMCAAEGLSNREIGGRLHLSEGTVRNYLSTAFAKLGVSRRAELGRLVPAQPSD